MVPSIPFGVGTNGGFARIKIVSALWLEGGNIPLDRSKATRWQLTQPGILDMKGRGSGIDVEEIDMLRANLQCHEAERSRAGKGLEQALASDELREVEHVVHQASLGTAQRKNPKLVVLAPDLGLDRETVREAIENLYAADLAGSPE
jgi:hypothetical protein